ncbi:MAG: glycosyltransferase family 4 protein [Candidatus Scalindua sediminis]|nr:glycosyltransferase family 4 protein [Candidatus Scalindua sediminis]
MEKKLFIISELICAPFDEGLKNIVYNFIVNCQFHDNVNIVTKKGSETNGLNVKKVSLNKLFLNKELNKLLCSYSPDIILYIPEASCTFNSFVRARILQLMCNKSKVVILGSQRRKYSFIKKFLLGFLRPDLLLLLCKADKGFFETKGMRVKILPPAIDKERFCCVDFDTKFSFRRKYNIPLNKTIVLHVGHIRKSRNLGCFLNIQNIDCIQVVIVGSTTTKKDYDLFRLLKSQGIIIIDYYISGIQEIYQLSDIYVFPVKEETAAIDMPLSVLEAMACNLPVITTRFGGLIDNFSEDKNFRYVDTNENITELVKINDFKKVTNRSKVKHLTWNFFADKIVQSCEGLLQE